MSTGRSRDPDTQHELRNQLALISGYSDLLLSEAPPEHPWHGDLLEIHKAAAAALMLLRRQDDQDRRSETP